MNTLFSQPKIPLLASSLPRTQPWRVHVICLCQIGGFTVTSAFLFLLGLNLAEIPANYLLLPHAVVNLAVPVINTFVAASGIHALSVYTWGRSALQQTTIPGAEPVPAHGMRNEITASGRRNEGYVPLTCRRDGRKREKAGKRAKNLPSCLTKGWSIGTRV